MVVLLATLTLVNFISALQSYRSGIAEAERVLDAQLTEIAALVLSTHAQGRSAVTAGRNLVWQVWKGAELVARSADAPTIDFVGAAPGLGSANFGGYRWRTDVQIDPASGLRVSAAQRMDARFAVAESIVAPSVVPNVLALPVLGLLIWLIVRHGLQPLQRLADELKSRQPGALDPLNEGMYATETRHIVASINALLARLGDAFERERRLAADAAHELRTPIAAVNVHAHNLGTLLDADAATSPATRIAFQELQASIRRTSHVVEQVLALNRVSPERFAERLQSTDLATIAVDVIARHIDPITSRGQDIELDGHPAPLTGDPFSLAMMLTNLIDNACKYTPAGGSIRVTTHTDHGVAILRVEDSGPGIDTCEHERVLAPFYRVGGDRHDPEQPGAGLGLAIVKHIAHLHGATVELGRSAFATGLSVTICFDRAVTSLPSEHHHDADPSAGARH